MYDSDVKWYRASRFQYEINLNADSFPPIFSSQKQGKNYRYNSYSNQPTLP